MAPGHLLCSPNPEGFTFSVLPFYPRAANFGGKKLTLSLYFFYMASSEANNSISETTKTSQSLIMTQH